MKNLRLIFVAFFGVMLAWACESEKEPIIDPSDCQNEITITLSNEVAANCGQSDGAFTVSASGGEGDYTYQIVGGNAQASTTFQNLAAGVYTVVATDALGCTAEANIQVRNEDGVNATFVSTDSDCNTPQGTIQVTATDGQTPYQYKLDDGAFQAADNFTDLAPGAYVVTVRDAGGCEVELQASVSSTVTFNQIRTLVQTNCAVSGCHDGTISPNFTVDSNIIDRSGRIRARTSARTMTPRRNPPSQPPDFCAGTGLGTGAALLLALLSGVPFFGALD